jgi:hypothetical protein
MSANDYYGKPGQQGQQGGYYPPQGAIAYLTQTRIQIARAAGG